MLDACAQGVMLGITGDLTLAELRVLLLRQNDAAAVAALRKLLIDDGAITPLPPSSCAAPSDCATPPG